MAASSSSAWTLTKAANSSATSGDGVLVLGCTHAAMSAHASENLAGVVLCRLDTATRAAMTEYDGCVVAIKAAAQPAQHATQRNREPIRPPPKRRAHVCVQTCRQARTRFGRQHVQLLRLDAAHQALDDLSGHQGHVHLGQVRRQRRQALTNLVKLHGLVLAIPLNDVHVDAGKGKCGAVASSPHASRDRLERGGNATRDGHPMCSSVIKHQVSSSHLALPKGPSIGKCSTLKCLRFSPRRQRTIRCGRHPRTPVGIGTAQWPLWTACALQPTAAGRPRRSPCAVRFPGVGTRLAWPRSWRDTSPWPTESGGRRVLWRAAGSALRTWGSCGLTSSASTPGCSRPPCPVCALPP